MIGTTEWANRSGRALRRRPLADPGGHRRGGEADRHHHAEHQQHHGVEHGGVHRRGLGVLQPVARVLEAVERRAAEQHRDHPHQAGPGRRPVEVVQRAAQHQRAVRAPPEERQPADQRGVRLERVGPVDPAAAEDAGAEHDDGDVQRDPEPHRSQVRRLRVDELQPHEGEQAERRRPVADPCRQRDDPLLGVASGQPGEHEVDRPDRVDGLVERPERQRGRHDPHPQEHVEDAERGVHQQVGAEHRGPARVQEQRHPEHAQDHREDGGVDETGQPRRRRPTAVDAVEARVAPGQREDDERDGECGAGPGDGVLGGDRQVFRSADSVGEDHVRRPRCSGGDGRGGAPCQNRTATTRGQGKGYR